MNNKININFKININAWPNALLKNRIISWIILVQTVKYLTILKILIYVPKMSVIYSWYKTICVFNLVLTYNFKMCVLISVQSTIIIFQIRVYHVVILIIIWEIVLNIICNYSSWLMILQTIHYRNFVMENKKSPIKTKNIAITANTLYI